MNIRQYIIFKLIVILCATTSCRGDYEEISHMRLSAGVEEDTITRNHNDLWERHRDTPLKILAIGNSFTLNATTYMPQLIWKINRDGVCVTTLIRSSCSLSMHWDNHVNNSTNYKCYYNDNADWIRSEITTIDEALTTLDWDIIIIQQVSGYSGIYSSFQPYLNNLVDLFRETNPSAMLAWHYTWAYTSLCQHPDFKNYDNDSDIMYSAVMEAGDRASDFFDLKIPSATLIKRLREEFPDVEDGFSKDGQHISDRFALYALSSLWYDVLIEPWVGTMRHSIDWLPVDVDEKGIDKMEEIISNILEKGPGSYEDADCVPMIHQ